jgi:ABC-type lipoprotein export system ATPase subunit
MSSLLEVRHLCKGYRSGPGRLTVLSDLSLDLTEGEMAAITGVSGSGKSTLLHLLGGMDRADSGSIKVLSQEITALDLPALSRFRNAKIGRAHV